jgi:hypothetical protein
MKYIKRLALNKKDQQSNRFAVEADDRIVTTSKVSLQLPTGATGDRPSPVNGQIRYNTSINDSEIYNAAGLGTGWERVKTNRQGVITQQNLGTGNYLNTVFGPLSYDIDITKPQNILVFQGAAFQIPTVAYSIKLGSNIGVTRNTTGPTSVGTDTIVLTSVADVLLGEVITAATGIAGATTVTSVTTVTNSITISNNTIGVLSDGTACTFSAPSGTARYIQFTSPAPADQVTVLLGFDGYTYP